MNPAEQLIDKILQHFAGPAFKSELEKAKKEFFGSQNLLEEQNAQFELRMSQFFDWYFFTRELSGYGRTPLEVCQFERELRFTPEEELMLENLKKHRHSLFEFRKVKGEDMHLNDLIANEKIVVRKSSWIYGFDTDEIFEARLIPGDGGWFFTRGFCFHPESAKKFILDEIKKHRKDPDLDPDELMLRLVKMRSKCEQYKHVRPEMIYSEDSKL
ncbi:MAG: hypothetical protein KF802_13010 [Bdellovibrionaceae bacterium]|nr:hypothetical protein [Pseudobdellovibrionaceae bacterium]MBX3035016.1 hypothetical protein [Pseudobdellovibrionaceae bacterium]